MEKNEIENQQSNEKDQKLIGKTSKIDESILNKKTALRLLNSGMQGHHYQYYNLKGYEVLWTIVC